MNIIRGRIDFEVEVPDDLECLTSLIGRLTAAAETCRLAIVSESIGATCTVRTAMVSRRKGRVSPVVPEPHRPSGTGPVMPVFVGTPALQIAAGPDGVMQTSVQRIVDHFAADDFDLGPFRHVYHNPDNSDPGEGT